MGVSDSKAEGKIPFHGPVGHTALDAAQDTFVFRGCKDTWPTHVELLVHQHPTFFSSGLLSIHSLLSLLFLLGLDPSCKTLHLHSQHFSENKQIFEGRYENQQYHVPGEF